MGLFPVEEKGYCGATAVSAITGVPVSHVEKMVRRLRRNGYRNSLGRKMPIRGTYSWEIKEVLCRLGCKVTPMKTLENTFGRFCEDTVHVDAPFLVNVTRHLMATYKGTICDTSNRTPVPAEGYRAPSRRVKQAWRVDLPARLNYSAPMPKPPKEKKPKPSIREIRAARVAARLKAWQTKLKRSETMVKKLKGQAKYYGLEID